MITRQDVLDRAIEISGGDFPAMGLDERAAVCRTAEAQLRAEEDGDLICNAAPGQPGHSGWSGRSTCAGSVEWDSYFRTVLCEHHALVAAEAEAEAEAH